MKEIRGMVVVCAMMVLAGGCASRPAEQVSATGTGGANGTVVAGGDSTPSHSGKLFTAMAPRDAAVAAAKALNEKFGLQIGSAGNWYPEFGEQYVLGDHFSASAEAKTASGGTIQMAFEWIKEGETEVTLTSDLPDAQYEASLAVIRSAIGGADYK
jgi:hypothetical protein